MERLGRQSTFQISTDHRLSVWESRYPLLIGTWKIGSTALFGLIRKFLVSAREKSWLGESELERELDC
jgi:hypothetical protein